MSKKACKKNCKKADKKDKEFKYVCGKCGRGAKKKSHVCKPAKA